MTREELIPRRFLSRLSGNPVGLAVIADIETIFSLPWILDAHLLLFPDFTSHGPKHVQAVLNEIDQLIPESVLEKLNGDEISVMILSVAFHDLGMHLSPRGLKRLVSGQSKIATRFEPFQLSTRTQEDTWNDFLDEVSHFDKGESRRLFGISEAVNVTKMRVSEDWNEWRPHETRVAGEFVRRNHSRFAQEFALSNIFPDATGDVSLTSRIKQEFRELAGYAARSHGMDLRRSVRSLKDHYGGGIFHAPFGVRIIFLMVLLRIADYLQIDNSRIHHLYRLHAPQLRISLMEFQKHASVSRIPPPKADSDQIIFGVEPTTAEIFLHLREMFADIQRELDTSWSVLISTYGGELGISKRRITTSFDEEGVLKRYPFYPERVKFEVSPSLLRTLVVPLYGNRPEIGVRELMQNAIDAVWQLRSARGTVTPLRIDEPEVLISLQASTNTPAYAGVLEIRDRGIGMRAETVARVFLNAGHKPQRTAGDYLYSQIGCFGLGILAAFLLGHTLEIRTRHFHESQGWCFEANLDSDPIELRKCECEVGTCIRVFLSPRVFQILKDRPDLWDWYCLTEVAVKRSVLGNVERQAINLTLPPTNGSKEWHLFANSGASIFWRYMPISVQTPDGEIESDQIVVANGIRVFKGSQTDNWPFLWRDDQSLLQINCPSLATFGSGDLIGLNIARDKLDWNQWLFLDVYLESLLKADLPEYLSQNIFAEEEEYYLAKPLQLDFACRNCSAISCSGVAPFSPWVLLPGAFTLFEPNVVSQAGITKLIFIPLRRDQSPSRDDQNSFGASILQLLRSRLTAKQGLDNKNVGLVLFGDGPILNHLLDSTRTGCLLGFQTIGFRYLIDKEQHASMNKRNLVDLSKSHIELDRNSWVSHRGGEIGECTFSLESAAERSPDETREAGWHFRDVAYAEWQLSAESATAPNPISSAWMQVFRNSLILPLDLAFRKNIIVTV